MSKEKLIYDTLSQLSFNGHLDSRITVSEARAIISKLLQEPEGGDLKTMTALEWFEQSGFEYKLDEHDEGGYLGIDENEVSEMLDAYYNYKLKLLFNQPKADQEPEGGGADLREKLSCIIRNAKLIDAEREEKAQVFSPSTNHRLDEIVRMAQDNDRLKLAQADQEPQRGITITRKEDRLMIDAFIEMLNDAYEQGWYDFDTEEYESEQKMLDRDKCTYENTMPTIKLIMQKLSHSCKHIKKIGAGCILNDGCKFPECADCGY